MASPLAARALSANLLPPSLPPTPPRLSVPSSWASALRMPCFSGRVSVFSRAAHARQPRFHVAPKASQIEAQQQEEREQQETEESATETTDGSVAEEPTLSSVQVLLMSLRDAFVNNDAAKITEIESQLLALEEERDELSGQVTFLTEEVSIGKDRFLRLNADFDNFRKRSERDRVALTTTVKGDVIESLLPMVDNFERAKAQIKAETEGEQRIDNSYQGIYKQFVEIMRGVGVAAVETVGKEFDPNVHEAIMREESTEYEEGIVTQEFRRGFMLGDKLLRPAMVKVSAGPGPSESKSAVNEVLSDEARAEMEQTT